MGAVQWTMSSYAIEIEGESHYETMVKISNIPLRAFLCFIRQQNRDLSHYTRSQCCCNREQNISFGIISSRKQNHVLFIPYSMHPLGLINLPCMKWPLNRIRETYVKQGCIIMFVSVTYLIYTPEQGHECW